MVVGDLVQGTDRSEDGCLAGLASRIAERERRRGRPLSSVRIEVWRTEFAPVTLEPTRRILREFASTEPSALR